jgi:lipopolysaccharide/colanic/teichoic acid biosynthesis glycosyltransferase
MSRKRVRREPQAKKFRETLNVAVGWMSSFSFDKVPDPGEIPESVCVPAERRSKPFLVSKERMLSHASPWAKSTLRRVVDCGVAAAALVLLMPLLVFAAALVLADSRGPILFRQGRMGRSGKEFTLYKFRSMKVETGRQTCVTASGDARITRAGAFLRRHKLDELPQFWNVLRGDMALVGPRPKLPHLEPLHMTCRPGITGAATLAFRDEEALLSGIPENDVEAFYERFIKPAKAELDMEYMRTATFRSDLAILWKTFGACLSRNEKSQEQNDRGKEPGRSANEYPAMDPAPSPES